MDGSWHKRRFPTTNRAKKYSFRSMMRDNATIWNHWGAVLSSEKGYVSLTGTTEDHDVFLHTFAEQMRSKSLGCVLFFSEFLRSIKYWDNSVFARVLSDEPSLILSRRLVNMQRAVKREITGEKHNLWRPGYASGARLLSITVLMTH